MAIGVSALLIGVEAFRRLLEPRLIEHIPWVIAAGLVGAVGNELVARYRTRIGRRIGSEALIADGRHARSDAWTSLAVVAAARREKRIPLLLQGISAARPGRLEHPTS